MYFLLFVSVSSAVLSGLVYKRNNRSPLVTVLGSTFWGLLVIGAAFLVNFAFTDAPFANISWKVIGWISLKSVLQIIGIFLWACGIKRVPVSIADPFTLSKMFFLLGFSWLLWGDTVSTAGIILVVSIFAAAIIMGVLQHLAEKTNKNAKGYVKGLLILFAWTVVSTAAALVSRQAGESGVHPVTYSMIMVAISFVIACLLTIVCRKSLGGNFKQIIKDPNQFCIGLTDGVSTLVYIPLALVMNLGVLDAISVISTVIVVLCGVAFLKEKIRWYIYPFIFIIIGCSIALALLT